MNIRESATTAHGVDQIEVVDVGILLLENKAILVKLIKNGKTLRYGVFPIFSSGEFEGSWGLTCRGMRFGRCSLADEGVLVFPSRTEAIMYAFGEVILSE